MRQSHVSLFLRLLRQKHEQCATNNVCTNHGTRAGDANDRWAFNRAAELGMRQSDSTTF